MLTAIVIIFFFLIVLIDLIPLIKSKKKKESFLYLGILIPGFTISLLYTLDIPLPTHFGIIKDTLDLIFGTGK